MLRRFVNFSTCYICWSGALGLLIGVPLAAFGALNPEAPRGLFAGMMAGVAVLVLGWGLTMSALGGVADEDEWKKISRFRKLLLFIMSTPMLYVGAFILFGLVIAALVFLLLFIGAGAGLGALGGEEVRIIEHYDRYGRYKGYSREEGGKIEHYDERGNLKGASKR